MRIQTLGLGAVLLTALMVSNGCGDGATAPEDPDDPNLGLAIAVRVDEGEFRQSGEFSLDLIPTTSDGQSLVAEPWNILTTVMAPAQITPALRAQSVLPVDTAPPRVALLVDNSTSMATNDPQNLRVAAAEMLWDHLFSERPTAEAALLHFGLRQPPTPGFTTVGLLQTWSTDPAELSGILDTLTRGPGSQIYTAALEAINWIDSTTPGHARRVLLLLTDGQLNREPATSATPVFEAAHRANVSIGTVALGPASDKSPNSDPAAVMLLQELANGTGGLYAGTATAEELSSTLVALTASSSDGVLRATLQLSPIPAPGSQVSGRVRLENPQHGAAAGTWSFVAP